MALDEKNFAKWNKDQVAQWLSANGFEEYVENFRSNDVDGESLGALDQDLLKDIGVTKVGPRAKLLKRIKEMQDLGKAPAPAPAAAAPAPAPAATTQSAQPAPAGGVAALKGGRERSNSDGKRRLNPDGSTETKEQRNARKAAEKNAEATREKGGPSRPQMSGWLQKEGGNVKSWKRRFFVLQDYVLSYYKSEQLGEPLGRFPIPSYEVDYFDRKPFGFQVSHAGCRTYYFAADDRQSMDAWMKAIREQGLATASVAWFKAEAKHFQVKRRGNNEDTPLFDVEMTMDPDQVEHAIVPGATYRYKCKWRRGEEQTDVYIETSKHALTVSNPGDNAKLSEHPYTVIQRYTVDAADPIFSFLQVKGGLKTVFSFHMGNHALARHINQVMTGHIAELTKIIMKIKQERQEAAAAEAARAKAAAPAASPAAAPAATTSTAPTAAAPVEESVPIAAAIEKDDDSDSDSSSSSSSSMGFFDSAGEDNDD